MTKSKPKQGKKMKRATAPAKKAANQNILTRIKRIPRAAWVAVWVVVFGAIGIKLTFFSEAAVFQEVGVHPQASQQPVNSGGRSLTSLVAWNGKIYAGFGDWTANTGPVALTPWDPKTGAFASTPEHVSDTEAIDLFRVINGKLYAPATDPRSSADYAVGDATSGSVKFNDKQPARMTHVFDVATYDGNDLWFFGSKDDNPVTATDSGNHAQAWRSTDGGTTWAKSFDMPSATDPVNSASRLYLGARYNGKLYTQQTDFSFRTYVAYGTPQNAWVYSGGAWQKTAAINTAIPFKGTEFAGKLILKSNPYGGSLLAYDGRSTSTVLGGISDYTVAADGYVYAIASTGSDRVIKRSKDLTNWEQLMLAPSTSRSIAVLDNYIYVGTSESRLYRADVNSHDVDTTPPTISLLSPATGTTVNGQTQLTAKASDAAGIKKVEFYVGSYLVTTTGSSYATPGTYSITWGGSGVPNGVSEVRALAYDTYGNVATASATVTIVNSTEDTTGPTIKLSSPYPDMRIKRSLRVSASAADQSGVVEMVLQYDDTIIGRSTSGSVSATVDSVSRGAHKILVTARDRWGNISTYPYDFTK